MIEDIPNNKNTDNNIEKIEENSQKKFNKKNEEDEKKYREELKSSYGIKKI